ncbi:hypothetical protein YB2330_005560 [Saitoella coloradoensis]
MIKGCRPAAFTLAFLLFLVHVALARSPRPPPITTISLIHNASLTSVTPLIDQSSIYGLEEETTHHLTFRLPGHYKSEYVRLSLHPNSDILHPEAHIDHVDTDGSLVKREFFADDESLREIAYKGRAFVLTEQNYWRSTGWARIVLLRKSARDPVFEGAFLVDGETIHIQTQQRWALTARPEDVEFYAGAEEKMVAWRDADQGTLEKRVLAEDTCSLRGLDVLDKRFREGYTPSSEAPLLDINLDLVKRQSDSDTGSTGTAFSYSQLQSTIGETNGCPTRRMVAYVGAAADCTYTTLYTNDSSARQHIINLYNTASELYESSFNISLGLLSLTVAEADCPTTASSSAQWNVECSDSISIDDRLNLFSQWRGDSSRSGDGIAVWTLFTTCNTASEVGVAWVGSLCQSTASASSENGTYYSGASVVASSTQEWKVLAHEVGHVFGAVHDCTSTTCGVIDCCPLSSSTCDANGAYIMNPSTSTNQDADTFSPCSIGNVCSAMLRAITDSSCLVSNQNVTLITSGECGNGIVEDGEDCDCGGEAGCGDNTCCDPTTCKFINNAVCDDANEACCTDCQFSSSTTVCRASIGECDYAEYCPGNSSLCPSDTFKDNGVSCGNSSQGLACASGVCTSRDLQCQQANITGTVDEACSVSQNPCLLSCLSSRDSNTCILNNQYFIAGTSCGSGGYCSGGQCVGQSEFGDVGSWVDRHKSVVIIIASVIGGLIIVSIVAGCLRRKIMANRAKRMAAVQTAAMPMNTYSVQQQGWQPQGGYSDGGGYYPRYSVPPNAPPPVYHR